MRTLTNVATSKRVKLRRDSTTPPAILSRESKSTTSELMMPSDYISGMAITGSGLSNKIQQQRNAKAITSRTKLPWHNASLDIQCQVFDELESLYECDVFK